MKKFLTLVLALAMLLTLAACGNQAKPQEEKAASNLIAVCLPTLDNPLMVGIGDAVTAKFPDKEVKVTSADGDPSNQVSQIQNYITMKADELIVMPVDANSVMAALAEARAAGIKVLVCGTQMSDAEAYDCMATCNQFLVGSYSAYLVKTWMDKNYPDAAPGSIECAALTSSLNEDSIDKSTGMLQVFEQYLKDADGNYVDADGNVVADSAKIENPAYCPALKLVQNTEAEMADAAITAFQNVLLTNPDVKVVLCCTGDGAGAVSQVFMDKGLSADELAKIGVFGCGFIGSEKDYIEGSTAGTSVFRATVAFGGGDLPGEMAELAGTVLDGTAEKDVWDPIALVYMDNTNALQMKDVNNIGAIRAEEVNW
jgi:ABC-type sugar transport system substrate-binding protein